MSASATPSFCAARAGSSLCGSSSHKPMLFSRSATGAGYIDEWIRSHAVRTWLRSESAHLFDQGAEFTRRPNASGAGTKGVVTADVSQGGHTAMSTDKKGTKILARTFFTQLRAGGYTPNQILDIATELIDLVTTDL